MSYAIRMQDVTVRYQRNRKLGKKRFDALSNITLDLRHGDKLGVIGRNGAGKSTLLRLMAGVFEPDRGSIEHHHGSVQLLALGIGFVASLTGRENAVLSGLLQGVDRKKIVSNLDSIQAFSELGDFFDEPLSTYSSGMKARLGFSVAIQQQPDVLLIDEVLAVGDAGFKAKSVAALQEKMQTISTLVIVSHDERIIRDTCNRVIRIENGRLVGEGDVESMLKSYASESRNMNNTSDRTVRS